jgi:hypothetical protein
MRTRHNVTMYAYYLSCCMSTRLAGSVISPFKGLKPVVQLVTSYNLKIHGLLYLMLALFQQPVTKTLAASANMADKYACGTVHFLDSLITIADFLISSMCTYACVL